MTYSICRSLTARIQDHFKVKVDQTFHSIKTGLNKIRKYSLCQNGFVFLFFLRVWAFKFHLFYDKHPKRFLYHSLIFHNLGKIKKKYILLFCVINLDL